VGDETILVGSKATVGKASVAETAETTTASTTRVDTTTGTTRAGPATAGIATATANFGNTAKAEVTGNEGNAFGAESQIFARNAPHDGELRAEAQKRSAFWSLILGASVGLAVVAALVL